MAKKLRSRCPFCEGDLAIASLHCTACQTKIESELHIPRFFRLGEDLQHFVLVFLRCRGNIREVEKALGISYPTVCKRLDQVNVLLAHPEELPTHSPESSEADHDRGNGSATSPSDRQQILGDLESGKITATEAAHLLRRHNPSSSIDQNP